MDGEPVTLAAVPAIGSRLYASFGLGNELHIVDLADGNAASSSTATVVQWGDLSAGQRRIAYDTQGQYQSLQGAALEPLSPAAWSATLQYSRTVSAILGADGVRGVEATPEELVVLQERALWDLLSLFFLERSAAAGGDQPHPSLAQDLTSWLRAHATAVAGGVRVSPLAPALAAELRAASLPEAHPAYWPTAARLVALGWVDDAIELLGLHSAWLRYEGPAEMLDAVGGGARALVSGLEAATLLLRRFPVLAAPGAAAPGAGRQCASAAEFAAYRRTWQAQCAALAADGGMWAACEQADAATAAGLRALLSVLAGDDAALASAAANWLELLVAQLLHVYPTARGGAEQAQLARRAFEAGGGAQATDFLQAAAGLLDACAELEAQAAMRVCSATCSSWFMAHASVLMAAHPAGASILGAELPHAGGSQVEFYTLEYALALAPHPSTWPLAAAYLAWAPAHGRPALAALLRSLPLAPGQPWAARKAAEAAERQGLLRAAQDIRRRQGVLCWQAGQPGAALAWLAAADDLRRADLVLRPLADAVSAGQVSPEQAAALDVLQPTLEALPPGSAAAALLAVHRLLRQRGGAADGGLHAAVAALAQLPERQRDSCLRLVCGAVPTLAPGELAEQDVLYLLRWLLSAEGRLPPGPDGSALASAVQTARLALVRCLAGSHMRQPAAAAAVIT